MKKTRSSRFVLFAAVCCILGAMISCASVGERTARDTSTAHVGVYDPPPPGAQRVRVGVPPFGVERPRGRFSFSTNRLDGIAADQMTTLLHQTGRFNVIERAQLVQLLAEQGLEGIVRAGEMAGAAQVRGVDYLMLGKVTGFRVTSQRTKQEFGLGRGWVSDKIEGVTGGYEMGEMVITFEMGVDLRLVDPTTGEIKSAHFSQFRQQDTAKRMGIEVAGVGGSGDADVRISQDDAGRVMRLAFDDTLRKMLPEIDRSVLVSSTGKTGTAPIAAAFCSQCGERVEASAKFCGNCGAPLQ